MLVQDDGRFPGPSLFDHDEDTITFLLSPSPPSSLPLPPAPFSSPYCSLWMSRLGHLYVFLQETGGHPLSHLQDIQASGYCGKFSKLQQESSTGPCGPSPQGV